MKNSGTKEAPIEGINRRNFLKLLGGGIAVALTYTELNALSKQPGLFPPGDDTVAAWIHILENGTVTVYTGKVEVGQNIRTSLSQAVAEELGVPVGSIEMVMGDTLLTPYDRGTYGSLTTPTMAPKLRKAAATLREELANMAARQWNVSKQTVAVKNGQVIHAASGKTISFSDLTKGQKILLPVNEQVPLTPAEKWTTAGTAVAKVNAKSFVSGKHQYVSDMTMPGMVYGKILRPPSYGASLLTADIENAKRLPGVTVIKEDNFIGVTAPDPQTAANALARIEARWKTVPQPSRAEIFTWLKTHAEDKEQGAPAAVKEAWQAAPIQVQQHFEVQYIAHVPLEPRAALAVWENKKLTVWTGTQRPFGVQEQLAEIFSIPKNNVRVMMPDTGSAYGGKHSGEAAVEAARLARATGKPVKVMWTREEEFKWAYFRPGGLVEVTAGASREGLLTSWEFHNYNSGGAGIEVPYEVTQRHIQYHPSDTPLKQGSYRGLAATANVFSIESVMDDLARQLKQDPFRFRLNNLKDERLKQVLEAAASKFGWTRQKNTGVGYGIACAFVKNAYVATCAEVAYNKSNGQLQLLRLVVAFECGAIVNPLHLENQVMGCVLQGLGGALFEAVDFKDGRILNPSLSSYRVPRFADIPELDIVLLNRKDLPSSGAGEAPIVGVAPAIRNAIADVTGVKLYTLPLLPHGMTLKT
ncbi:xanthine dehydrogenase family protein molybdopterin-binding subunit [Chitinophaga sp.]|uniref:xanthine dehydrogenase family protein molybdopterin-binding subunit n=1 Tax=Chitinophaga sp. TaxID=1869181 RepID=UPI002C351203|nr:molybdopterin cofactor-binding domain-containing protein [Chitinophaga sp.]HWV64298.1 molybdopterin cofactor-binding domain-containing protein [Chitinophaga sp.]